MIRLRLETQPLEKIPCYVAVIFFDDTDPPLHGPAGKIDACLGGEAGRLLGTGHLNGSWGSQALLASEGRMAPQYALFAGMGHVEGMAARGLSVRVEEVTRRVVKLSARSMAMYVPPSEGPRGEYHNLAAETLNGALRGVAGCPYDVDITFSEPDPGCWDELVAAAERAVFRHVKGQAVSVEVLV